MKPSLQFLPEPHTEFKLRLVLDSPLAILAAIGVLGAIAFAVWWFAVKRRR